jgi:hypothetical protein
MRLIDVESDLIAALEALMLAEEEGREPDPESLALAKQYAINATEKRDACATFLSFVEGREAELAERIKTLSKQRMAIANARERFEGYILMTMQASGLIMACGALSKFVVKISEATEVDNPDALPADFTRVKIEADKTAVKKYLKDGHKLPEAAGARIVSRETLAVKPLAVKDRPGSMVYGGTGEVIEPLTTGETR